MTEMTDTQRIGRELIEEGLREFNHDSVVAEQRVELEEAQRKLQDSIAKKSWFRVLAVVCTLNLGITLYYYGVSPLGNATTEAQGDLELVEKLGDDYSAVVQMMKE